MPLEKYQFITTAVIAILGISIALWRSIVAARQLKASQEQVAISQQSITNERFKTGIELLGSGNTTARLGGVYILADMTRLDLEKYHIRVMELFVSFLQYPPQLAGAHAPIDPKGADISAILEFINKKRTDKHIRIEELEEFNLGLALASTHFPLINGKATSRNLHRVLRTRPSSPSLS